MATVDAQQSDVMLVLICTALMLSGKQVFRLVHARLERSRGLRLMGHVFGTWRVAFGREVMVRDARITRHVGCVGD